MSSGPTSSPGSGDAIAASALVKPSAQADASEGDGRKGFSIIWVLPVRVDRSRLAQPDNRSGSGVNRQIQNSRPTSALAPHRRQNLSGRRPLTPVSYTHLT